MEKKILCSNYTFILDNFWVGDLLKKNQGQGIVEYILMTAMIMLIFTSILKSDRFKSFFGDDADFFKKLAQKVQFEYRHGVPMRPNDTTDNGYTGLHETYTSGNGTRFFVSETPYEE